MTDAALRDEVRAWLAANWRGAVQEQRKEWRKVTDEDRAWLAKVVEARWAVPRWPAEWYGRGLSDAQGRIVEREFARVGAPGTGQDRTNLWANTALAYATPTFKTKIVPALLKGEVAMCLLYSEPGAGSDLVSLKSSGALSSASSKSDEIRASDFMKLDSYRGGTGEGSKTGTQSEVSPSVVPEPETLSLLLLGLTAIGSAALRRR